MQRCLIRHRAHRSLDGDEHRKDEAHDIDPAEVDFVLARPEERTVSRSSGRPIVFGTTDAGRRLAVVFEELDEVHVYPITAYEVT